MMSRKDEYKKKTDEVVEKKKCLLCSSSGREQSDGRKSSPLPSSSCAHNSFYEHSHTYIKRDIQDDIYGVFVNFY